MAVLPPDGADGVRDRPRALQSARLERPAHRGGGPRMARAFFARGGRDNRKRERKLGLCRPIPATPSATWWWYHQARPLAALYGGGLWTLWCLMAKVPSDVLYRLVDRHCADREKAKRSLRRRHPRRLQRYL